MADILLSEHTGAMSEEERAALQTLVKGMNEEELKQFRNEFDPDEMGFAGEEGAEYEDQ